MLKATTLTDTKTFKCNICVSLAKHIDHNIGLMTMSI